MRLLVVEEKRYGYRVFSHVLDKVRSFYEDDAEVEIAAVGGCNSLTDHIERYADDHGLVYYAAETSDYMERREGEYRRNAGLIEYIGLDGVLVVVGRAGCDSTRHLIGLAVERGLDLYLYEKGEIREFRG